MEQKGQDGDFLVRDSESTQGDFSVSLKAPGRNKHFRVHVESGKGGRKRGRRRSRIRNIIRGRIRSRSRSRSRSRRRSRSRSRNRGRSRSGIRFRVCSRRRRR